MKFVSNNDEINKTERFKRNPIDMMPREDIEVYSNGQNRDDDRTKSDKKKYSEYAVIWQYTFTHK